MFQIASVGSAPLVHEYTDRQLHLIFKKINFFTLIGHAKVPFTRLKQTKIFCVHRPIVLLVTKNDSNTVKHN